MAWIRVMFCVGESPDCQQQGLPWTQGAIAPPGSQSLSATLQPRQSGLAQQAARQAARPALPAATVCSLIAAPRNVLWLCTGAVAQAGSASPARCAEGRRRMSETQTPSAQCGRKPIWATAGSTVLLPLELTLGSMESQFSE